MYRGSWQAAVHGDTESDVTSNGAQHHNTVSNTSHDETKIAYVVHKALVWSRSPSTYILSPAAHFLNLLSCSPYNA